MPTGITMVLIQIFLVIKISRVPSCYMIPKDLNTPFSCLPVCCINSHGPFRMRVGGGENIEGICILNSLKILISYFFYRCIYVNCACNILKLYDFIQICFTSIYLIFLRLNCCPYHLKLFLC